MPDRSQNATVSCVIPAWNEAERIARVLDVVTRVSSLLEVIVVDDYSTDGTADVVSRFPSVRLIRQPQNAGKTQAVLRGVREARGSHLLLLDADLQGLSVAAVSALLTPVISKCCDVSISLRGNAPGLWRLLHLDYISGERVIPRSQLADFAEEVRGLPRFGLEVWLNNLWVEEIHRIAVVSWPQVASPYKYAKMGWWKGFWGDMRMMRDIFRTISPLEAIEQIRWMRAHSVLFEVRQDDTQKRGRFEPLKI